MRYDREITFLLAEGLKSVERRAAAAELICILLHHSPSADELDALEAKVAGDAGSETAAAFRELRAVLGFRRPPQAA